MGLELRQVHRYGWVPSLPDPRDQVFLSPPLLDYGALPPHKTLENYCTSIFNQGNLGSCTANAGSTFFRILHQIEGRGDFVGSRLFIYWNERFIEGTVNSDSGASIRDLFKVMAGVGVPPESDWPYDVSQFTVRPSTVAFKDALAHEVSHYSRLDNTNLTQLLVCLASGFPFVMGISVFESFESAVVAQTGVVPIPGPREQMLGGHALCVVGYDLPSKTFRVVNSWGSSWGDHGFCTIPFDYVTSANLAADFWTARIAS